MYTEIKSDAVRFALGQIKDGWVFEEFAQKFLTARFSYEFVPVGGTGDKGIDGLEYTFLRKGLVKQIYQISTELNAHVKIQNTIKKLKENGITFSQVSYVTNRKINDKDGLINNFQDNDNVSVRVFDLEWFVTSVQFNEGTKNAYFTFIDSYLHEFSVPGKSYEVHKMDTDPRLFVFLRQQLDSKWYDAKIDDLLADGLILFALENTDPDKGVFKKEDEIMDSIREYVKFDPRLLHTTIKRRLKELSTKPRKINHYKLEDRYCLPYETRAEITQRNLSDKQLQVTFFEQTIGIIKKFLKENQVNVQDVTELVNDVIHRIFYQQGLEFSNFVLNKQSEKTMEKDLQDTINITVDESSVILKNKEQVKVALLMAIRDIIYNGTEEQRKYFKSLSNTYMMMFLLQWNPQQIALYFESMASKLNIYVCTSIIIPALSEYYLEEQNRRHWVLLKGAQAAGIALYVSDAIIDELVRHFKMLKTKYESSYKADEALYLENELQMLYIDEILMRAYFHAKARDKVQSFNDFLDNFCNPEMANPKDELIDFLKNKFGINYITDEKLNIQINIEEFRDLTEHLNNQKRSTNRAKTDSKIILSIYKQREKNNESSEVGIFGYRTWWLSKDTTTYAAIKQLFGGKYSVSCYMRPDFLYNHIALAPKKFEVDNLYKQIFPSLLGVI